MRRGTALGRPRLRARGTGGPVLLFAEIEGPTRRFARVPLGDPLPAEARGGRLAGIAIEPDTRLKERGADAGQAQRGSVTIELPDVPGGIDDWVGVGGARIDGTSVRYTLSNAVATRTAAPADRAGARPRDAAAGRCADEAVCSRSRSRASG